MCAYINSNAQTEATPKHDPLCVRLRNYDKFSVEITDNYKRANRFNSKIPYRVLYGKYIKKKTLDYFNMN